MADAASFTYAQLKSALFARDGGRVHAVIDGRIVPGLPQRLQEADTNGWDCLERGALSAEAMARSSYLAELRPEAPFTDWLLTEASAAFPGWGLVMASMRPLLPVREFCRDFDDVMMPDGERRPWRWHDPELLALLLPSLAPAQLDALFALGQQIVLPGAQRWGWHTMEQGVLASSERALLREPR
jgi:uncharacterized protein DUF4123